MTEARYKVPVFLGRVYSVGGNKRSAVLTSPLYILPNCGWHNIRDCRFRAPGDIAGYRRDDARDLIADHLAWRNRTHDPLLSWTSSLVYELSHALHRHELGQDEVYLAFGNVKRLRRWVNQETAPFYAASELINSLDMLEDDSMPCSEATSSSQSPGLFTSDSPHKIRKRPLCGMQPQIDRIMHEYLSFGEMADARTTLEMSDKFQKQHPAGAVMHAPLETLVEHGLFELIPELRCPPEHRGAERKPIWDHQEALYQRLFDKAERQDIDRTTLDRCEKLTMLFTDESEKKPCFWALVHFLACRSRPRKSPRFRTYVRKHYIKKDLKMGFYEGMDRVSVKCSDLFQTMLLVREAAEALELGHELHALQYVNPPSSGRTPSIEPASRDQNADDLSQFESIDAHTRMILQDDLYTLDGHRQKQLTQLLKKELRKAARQVRDDPDARYEKLARHDWYTCGQQTTITEYWIWLLGLVQRRQWSRMHFNCCHLVSRTGG